jgi:hypothetical protein
MKTQFVVQVEEAGTDAVSTDELALSLRRDLIELGVDDVEPVVGEPAPPGTRGLDLVAVGALLVTLGRSVAVSRLVALVHDWVAREPVTRTAKLTVGDRTIELTGATIEQQDKLTAEVIRLLDKD